MLPWQMKSTRIIKISYHKMPSNAEFCVGLSAFYGIVFFLFLTTLFYNSIIIFSAIFGRNNIRELIVILLDNAIKYSSEKPVSFITGEKLGGGQTVMTVISYKK